MLLHYHAGVLVAGAAATHKGDEKGDQAYKKEDETQEK